MTKTSDAAVKKFAYLVQVEGKTLSYAYRAAHPESQATKETIYSLASHFNNRPAVQKEKARLAVVQQEHAQQAAGISAEQYTEQLLQDIAQARHAKSWGSLFQGMKLLGDVTGYRESRTRHIHEVEKTREEVFEEMCHDLGPDLAAKVYEKETGLPAPTHTPPDSLN